MKKDSTYWGLLMLLTLVCVSVRIVCFTGLIGSDVLTYSRNAYAIASGTFNPAMEHQSTRLGLYLPTALMFKLFGVTEVASILPSFAYFLLTHGVLLVVATTLFGRWGGLLAGLLYALLPLEMFHATMFLADLPSSACIALSAAFLYFADGHATTSSPRVSTFTRRILLLLTGGMFGWAYLIRETALFFGLFIVGYLAWQLVFRKIWRWSWLLVGGGFVLVLAGELGYYAWKFGNPLYRYLSVSADYDPATFMDHFRQYFYGMSMPDYVVFDRLRVLFFLPDFGFLYFFVFAGSLYAILSHADRIGYVVGWFLTMAGGFFFASVSLAQYIPLRSVPRYFLAFSVPGILIVVWYLLEIVNILTEAQARDVRRFLLSLGVVWLLALIVTIRWFSVGWLLFLLGIPLLVGIFLYQRSQTWLARMMPPRVIPILLPAIFGYILIMPGIYMATKGERPRKGITCEREFPRLLGDELGRPVYTDSRTEAILEFYYRYQADERIVNFREIDLATLSHAYVIANWDRVFFLEQVHGEPIPEKLFHPPSNWVLRAQLGDYVNPCLLYEVP